MALSGIMSKVAFASKLPLLMKATSADPTPPAGHIYNEISRITFESLEQNDVLVEFLVERLKKSSPYIKWKVLLIMKAVLRNGHDEFRHSLSKQYHGISEAKSFSGPSDPLHGDSPYVNVREAAAEVLHVLFDTDWAQNKSNKSDTSGGTSMKMEGFGSSNVRELSGVSRAKLDDYHSSRDPSSKNVSLLSYAVQRVKDNLSYTFNENINAVAKYQQQEETSADRYKQFQDNERKFVTKPSQTFNLFGSSLNDKTEYFRETPKLWNHSDQPHYQDDSPVITTDTPDRFPSSDDTPVAQKEPDWSQEKSAVEKITAPERLNPSRSDLQEFIKRCEVLNFEKIVEFLGEKLECSDFRVQTKTLIVIESVLHRSVPNAQEIFASQLLSKFESLCSSSQKAIRNKSTKLLHMLKPQQTNPEAVQAKPIGNKQSQESQLVDPLLDLDLSSSYIVETKPQEIVTNDLITSSLSIDVTTQHNEEPSTMHNTINENPSFNDVFTSLLTANQKSNVSESQKSNVNESRKSNVNESQKSSSCDLLDLDPFSGIDSIVLSNPSQQTSTGLPMSSVSADINPTTTIDKNVNFDPFSLDMLSTPRAEPNTVEAAGSSNSNFDFLLFENKSVGNSTKNHTQPTKSSINYPSQAEMLQPIINQPQLTEKRQFPSQFRSMNKQYAMTHQSTTGNVSNMSVNVASPMSAGGQVASTRIPNHQRSADSNGFGFITSGKKAGAFDFVREAMEASKRK